MSGQKVCLCMAVIAWYLSGSRLHCQMLGWQGSWKHPLHRYPATGGEWGWGLREGLPRLFISLPWCKQAVAITINYFWIYFCGWQTNIGKGLANFISSQMLICLVIDVNPTSLASLTSLSILLPYLNALFLALVCLGTHRWCLDGFQYSITNT